MVTNIFAELALVNSGFFFFLLFVLFFNLTIYSQTPLNCQHAAFWSLRTLVQQELPPAVGMSGLFVSVRNQLTGSQGMKDNELSGEIDWRDSR